MRVLVTAVVGIIVLIVVFLDANSSLKEKSVVWEKRANSWFRTAEVLKKENAELRARLAYWECTDRTPEQPGEPTLVEDEK